MSMSMRALENRRALNKEVQYNNRLTQFTNPPIQNGDLYVTRNLSVGGNTRLQSVDVSGNMIVSGTIVSTESIYAHKYLPGQVVQVQMFNYSEISQSTQDISSNPAISTQTLFTKTYTPIIANSYIIIEYQTRYNVSGSAGDVIESYLYVNDPSENRISATQQQWNNGGGGGTRSGTIFPIVGRYTNTNTDTKTIRVDVFNNTNDLFTVRGDTSTWLKITEIGR